MKIVLLLLLEPVLEESDYANKFVPLIEKYISPLFFEVHIVGCCCGCKLLRQKFGNAYLIPYHPTTPQGMGFYLGYILYLIASFFVVVRLASKIRANVLVSIAGHAYSGFIIALAAKILRRRSAVRISEPTRYILGSLVSSLVRFSEWFAFTFSDIVISNRDMRWYSPRIAGKQRVISQGVDLSLFNHEVTPRFNSPDFPKIITVSRLTKQKNIESLIYALNLLVRKYPKVSCHIVGDGPYETRLRDIVMKLKLNGRVHFHGKVSLKEVPSLLRACDIFVLPSRIEGLPSAVLEAMACGLPVVVGKTKFGWHEWFVNEENAIIVAGDAQSVAEAIDKICSSEGLRNKLVNNGLRHTLEFHDSSKTKVKFARVIFQILEASK